MKNNKRGQAALEFLTTYGWAFMIILVMIGALAYFGVLNPRNLVPDSCAIQAGFTCSDYELEETRVGLVVQNNLGRAVTLSNFDITLNGNSIRTATACTLTPAATTADGVEETWDCEVTGLVAGEKEKLGYTFDYTDAVGGTFPHTVSGTLTATVK